MEINITECMGEVSWFGIYHDIWCKDV
jgi:hypothetical protein